MKLSDFKKQLETTPVDMEFLEKRFTKRYYTRYGRIKSCNTLLELIEKGSSFYDVIFHLLDWYSSQEGVTFWKELAYKRLKNVNLITFPGEVCPDYNLIVYDSGKIEVGCQILSTKQQLTLFKILGENLGYEVED